MAEEQVNKSREERENKARALRVAEERKRKRTVTLIVTGISVVVVIAIVAVVAIFQSERANNIAGGEVTPVVRYNEEAKLEVTKNSIIVGDKTAPHTFTIYEDLICPYCGLFERSSSGEFEKMIDSGEAKVEYIPIAFLDNASSDGRYSTRASSLLAFVADKQPDKWLALHKALYEDQPQEGSTLSNSELIDIAKKAGVSITPELESAVRGVSYGKWVASITEEASKAGVNATPTVKLDGNVIQARTADDVRNALDAAK